MHKNENREYIFKGLIILLIIFGIIGYALIIRPRQIKAKCTAELANKKQIYIQNREFAIKQSRIEREQHQETFAKLSEVEKRDPINIKLMKKWDINNIEIYEKTLDEGEKKSQDLEFQECIKRGKI